MLADRIEELRNVLNEELESSILSKDEILTISRKLDEAIIEYYRLNTIKRKETS